MYLDAEQIEMFRRLLKTFFSLPYSTDLDGKDAETLLRIVKDVKGRPSRRKELFDIIDGEIGYSVKTLAKSYSSTRVDLQEQRFCDVEEIRRIIANGSGSEMEQGRILLSYMRNRVLDQMKIRGVKVAKSLILLKNWNKEKTIFRFRYWEEDFLSYISQLYDKNERGEIEWIIQKAGLHGRDRHRQDGKGTNVRLLRMHYKHNQIFTDHEIPSDAIKIDFEVHRHSWEQLTTLLDASNPTQLGKYVEQQAQLPLLNTPHRKK